MNVVLEHADKFVLQAQNEATSKKIEIVYIPKEDEYVLSNDLDKLYDNKEKHLYWMPF